MAHLDAVVVGAGVSGLTTAVCLAEAGLRVLIRTDAPPESTTSAVAGALWEPYLVESGGRVWDWCRQSLDAFWELAGHPEAGVALVAGVEAAQELVEAPAWGELLDDFEVVGADRLPPGFATGWRFTAPMIDMPVYLSYLRRRFTAAGGEIALRPATSFAECGQDAPVVVNCTGLAARDLVPDPEVVPVRGQVVLVENPGIREFFATTDSEELLYILPHPEKVVLGGVAEHDAWSLEPDPLTAERIVAQCAKIWPQLATARVLAHKVGLRPVRPTIRVEEEPLPGGGRLLHNYGHGGAGITVSWGCAREIASMATAR